MSQPASRPMSLDEFFAWQESEDVRHELVGGQPLRMMVGVSNRHDRIVVNLIIALGNRLRGGGCQPFTGESAIETYPGQIRRPDVGVDCGASAPEAYKAAEPRVVIEVLSPSTRDFDTIGKLVEYKSVGSIRHILYVEPNRPEVRVWRRGTDGTWDESRSRNLDEAIDLDALGIALPLAEIYDGITFRSGPRLASGRVAED